MHPEISQGDLFKNTFSEFQGTAEVHIRQTFGLAMLLSRDCDFEKADHCLVAAIRPLSMVRPGDQGNVRRLKTKFTFYLEARDGLIEESYVDLRKLHVVDKTTLKGPDAAPDPSQRFLSLNEESRKALRTQIAIFFGYEPPPDSVAAFPQNLGSPA
jgi:hypothetical protein